MGELLSSQYQSFFSGFTRQRRNNKVMCDVISNNSNTETKYSESISKRISWVHYIVLLCLHNVINKSKYKAVAGALMIFKLNFLLHELTKWWGTKLDTFLDQRKQTYELSRMAISDVRWMKHMNNRYINEKGPVLEGLCAITQINAHRNFMKAQPDRFIFHNNNERSARGGWQGRRSFEQVCQDQPITLLNFY